MISDLEGIISQSVSVSNRPRTIVLETSPWETLLLGAMEVAMKSVSSGNEVDLIFLEDAATEQRRLKSLLRRVPLLSALLSAQPERIALKKFEEYTKSKNLHVKVHIVPKRSWHSFHERIPLSSKYMSADLRINGLSAGPYILSSFTHRKKDPLAVPKSRSWHLQSEISRFRSISAFTERILVTLRPNEVVVSNGRLLEQGAIVETCRELQIPVSFHEVGGRSGRRYFWQEWSPHDVKRRGSQALKVWDSLSSSERRSAADRILEKLQRAEKFGGLDPVLTGKRTSELPKHNPSSPLVVFFSSTELEFRHNQFLPQDGLSDQYQGVIALSRECRNLDWNLIVRVHPNVAKSSRAEKRRWDVALGRDMMWGQVCASDSGVDTYRLLRDADLVVVWHSSVGLEAVYRRIPTICLTESLYLHAGADVVMAKTAAELPQLLRKALEHRPRPESVYPSMHAFLTDGHEFEYLQADAFSYPNAMGPIARMAWRLVARP